MNFVAAVEGIDAAVADAGKEQQNVEDMIAVQVAGEGKGNTNKNETIHLYGKWQFLNAGSNRGFTPRIEVAPDILLRIRIISPRK